MENVTQGAQAEAWHLYRPLEQCWQFNRSRDVVMRESEMRVGPKVPDILDSAGDQIVETNNVVTFSQEPVAEIRTQKARTAGFKVSGL